MVEEKPGRIKGIEGWRAVLLLLGVAVHASTDPTGANQWVGVATHMFRMEAFFAISGLLAAIALQWQAPRSWFLSRLTVLGIPMILALFLLNPLAVVLGYWATTTRLDEAAGLAPHLRPMFLHVWFLWVLILCSAIAAWLSSGACRNGLARARRLATAIATGVPGSLRWPATLAGVYLVLCLSASFEQILRHELHGIPKDTPVHKLTIAVMESGIANLPYYLTMFFLGWGMWRSEDLRKVCIASWRLHAALVTAGVIWLAISYAAHGNAIFPYRYAADAVHPAYVWGGKVLIGLPAALLILRHALLARSTPPILARLARASYTIFVSHLLLIAVLALVLGPAWWGTIGYFLTVVVLTTIGGYVLHFGWVESSPWAALVLNGRIAGTWSAASREGGAVRVEMA